MKRIGLLGGMSWESTAIYYRLINQRVRDRLGGLHSAPIILNSIDFAPLEALQHAGRWDDAAMLLIGEAQRIEAAGAELLLICTNTMHRVADPVASAVSIPLLHIADATGERLRAAGIERVGLLGTRFTMEQAFYRGRLEARFDLEVLVPEADERERVHRVIYDELCLGAIADTSRDDYHRIIERLAGRGAQAVILGCTEIALLVDPECAALPLYDTAAIHAEAAVEAALADQ